VVVLHHCVITVTCPDRPGIVHAISGAVVAMDGNITESQQYSSPDTGTFFMRVQVEAQATPAQLAQALQPVAAHFRGSVNVDQVGRPMRTLILASLVPHCLEALLSHARTGALPITAELVLSNHATLAGLATFYAVPFAWQPVSPETKADFEQRIRREVEQRDIELVVLARYMQVLSPGLCDFLAQRAINIHHSFLPGFTGANPYRQAHARGVKIIGATAHFVTADLDEGPIIEQAVVRVGHAKSVADLRDIGQDTEAVVLTYAVKMFAQHRVLLDQARTVVFD
jgi:formyltetrahydrofolate deformylase